MKRTIADSVSDKIKKGEVTMRSQISIWAEKLKLNGSMVVLIALLIAVAGFVLYWVNTNNDLLFGGYGRPGLSSFVQSFPYIFVAIFILLFILLTLLFRTFDFSYKKPFFMILLLVAVGVLMLGWISIKQPIGQRLYQQEGRIFRMGMMNNSNAITGIVAEINKSGISVQNEDNEIVIINTNSNTHFPFGEPKVGDQIRAVGTWEGDVFTALGIRVFDETNPSTLGPGMMQGQGQGQGRGMMWNR